MNHRTTILFATIALSLGFLLFRCSMLLNAGGSEIGNPSQVAVMGSVVYQSSGAPAAGADVRLRLKTFRKDTAMAAQVKTGITQINTITDTEGRFIIDSVDTGDYCIEVNDRKSNGVLIVCPVRGAAPVKVLPVDSLRPTSTIIGTVTVVSPANTDAEYVQVYGLDRVARADPLTGIFLLHDIPKGSYDLRILSSSPAYAPLEVKQVRIESGAEVTIDAVKLVRFRGWQFSLDLSLNTSPTGADVTGDIFSFPVLLRLTRDVFDFSQASLDGSDIRFAKPDSTPLPYEIETWDATLGAAEVWVTVDTIYGSNSTQHIVMYWGNPEAEDCSNGPAVFDTASGCIAAWHLDNSCKDATANGHDGTNFGAEEAIGIIGNAMKFDGSDSIKIAGLLGQPATVTLSGWVKTDTMLASGQEIITLGDAVLIRADEIDGYGTGGYAHRYGDTAYTKVTSGLNIAKTGWRHLAFTFDNTAHVQSLFIDGVLVLTENSTYAIDYTGLGSNTFIGAHGNQKISYNNRGMIDETRVCRIARSSDWIKLCFMNQRTDDRLVEFKSSSIIR